jgi:hypothetical protein
MSLEGSPKAPLDPRGLAPRQVLDQLERILGSPPFRSSKRCSDLLSHVVHASCEGQLDFLKERTLGVAVFDRHPEYDTNQDPIVRNTAGQVRKRLAQYYCELGRDQELRIDLPAGAYVPQIHQPAVRAAQPIEVVSPPPVKRHWRLMAAVAAVILVAAILTLVLVDRHARTSVELFWAPMLRQPGAVVLCVGQGHTYKLPGDLDRRFETAVESPEGFVAPTGSIPLSALIPVWDRYIGINDAQTLVRLTALFAGFGRAVEFRGGRLTSLRDLRGRSSVLIGAFNNSWTLSLTGELRFYFDQDPTAGTFLVRDRLHPQNRAWEVRGDQQTAQDYMDYAIVSRVFDTTTERSVVVAAGIKGGGTAAAGEFLTNPAYLAQALRNAPAHWENKNLQFVLKTRLIGGNAGPPQVIAAQYW